MWIIFLATVNKCTITIIIIIIINVKSFLERHFCVISIYSFENNLTFIKNAVLHSDALRARQVLRDLITTNQGNSSETTFVTGATKSTSKFENLAMIGWLNARNNLKAPEVLPYKVKVLKPSS